METKRKLKIAVIFFKALKILTFALFFLILFFFIHSSFYPELYRKVVITKHYDISYKSNFPDAPETKEEIQALVNNNHYYWKLLTTPSKLWIMTNWVISLVLSIFILNYIIYFVKNYNYPTIFETGVLCMKKLKFCFILLIIKNLLFSFSGYAYAAQISNFQINKGAVVSSGYSFGLNSNHFIPLFAFIIICYTLELIFKEGERLREENELTV
jgi:hypothetical protein